MLGLLAPVVMGILGKQRRTQGLDVAGLSSLLASQKDHLGSHLQGGLADSLGLGSILGAGAEAAQGAGTAGLDAVRGAGNAAAAGVQTVGKAVGDAGQAVGSAGKAVGDAGKSGAGFVWTLLPLILLGALALYAFNAFSGGGEKDSNADADLGDVKVSVGDVAVPEITIPGFDTAKINETFNGLSSGLSGLSADSTEDSIRGLIPNFEQAGTIVDGLNLGAMAEGPQKTAMTSLFGGLIGKLKSAVETAYKIPGVEKILGPTINSFMEKFAALGI